MAKMRVIAGVEAFRSGLASTIVLTGGKTAGLTLPSEASAMKTFIERRYKKTEGKFSAIPPEVILLEEKSKDTSTNLRNILKLIERNGWQTVAILTNDFHLKRALRLGRNFGITTHHISAEKMLNQRDPRFG